MEYTDEEGRKGGAGGDGDQEEQAGTHFVGCFKIVEMEVQGSEGNCVGKG